MIEETLCPECHGKMTSRVNRSTGQRFWGCNDYQRCKGTRNTDGEANPVGNRFESSYEDRHKGDRAQLDTSARRGPSSTGQAGVIVAGLGIALMGLLALCLTLFAYLNVVVVSGLYDQREIVPVVPRLAVGMGISRHNVTRNAEVGLRIYPRIVHTRITRSPAHPGQIGIFHIPEDPEMESILLRAKASLRFRNLGARQVPVLRMLEVISFRKDVSDLIQLRFLIGRFFGQFGPEIGLDEDMANRGWRRPIVLNAQLNTSGSRWYLALRSRCSVFVDYESWFEVRERHIGSLGCDGSSRRQESGLSRASGVYRLPNQDKDFSYSNEATNNDKSEGIGRKVMRVLSERRGRGRQIPLYGYAIGVLFACFSASYGGWIYGRYDSCRLGWSLCVLGLTTWILLFASLLRGA